MQPSGKQVDAFPVVTPTPQLLWPVDVEAFAAQRGVTNYVPQIWHMTGQVFPDNHHLALRLEEDAEMLDDWRIRVEVKAPLTVSQLVERQRQWYDRLFAICPPPLAVWFCLALYPVA